MSRPCPHCTHGRISVDGGSQRYCCPDCNGSGYLPDDDEKLDGDDSGECESDEEKE